MKRLLLTIFLFGIPFLLLCQEEKNNLAFYQTDDFLIKFSVALISAILSFLIAFFMFLRKNKDKPIKQITYDLMTQELLEIGEKISDKILVFYNQNKISNLSNTTCIIHNSGNTLIKNQQIRFKLTSNSEFLEAIFDPEPERELQVRPVKYLNSSECVLNIGHFDKEQKITINFFISGDKAEIDLFPFNEEGGVNFNSDKITKDENDKEKLNRFFLIITLLILSNLILPNILIGGKLAMSFIEFTLKNLVNLIIFLFGLKDILTGLKIIASRIIESANLKNLTKIEHSKNIVVGNIHAGQSASIGDKTELVDDNDEQE